MEYRKLHKWPSNRLEAYEIQHDLAGRIVLYGDIPAPRLVAAVDVAYGYAGETLFGCAVTTTFPEIEEVERVFHHGTPRFPYIPGLKYFREGPVVIETLAKLHSEPDIIIVHGHGIAHPKRCGLASHVGLLFDRPTIGCARRLLVGSHLPLAKSKGSCQPLTLHGKHVGTVYRSKNNVKPIFISPGYHCDLTQAKEIVVRNLRGHRLPEPLRLAHLFANKYKRRIEKSSANQRSVLQEIM